MQGTPCSAPCKAQAPPSPPCSAPCQAQAPMPRPSPPCSAPPPTSPPPPTSDGVAPPPIPCGYTFETATSQGVAMRRGACAVERKGGDKFCSEAVRGALSEPHLRHEDVPSSQGAAADTAGIRRPGTGKGRVLAQQAPHAPLKYSASSQLEVVGFWLRFGWGPFGWELGISQTHCTLTAALVFSCPSGWAKTALRGMSTIP